MIAFVRGRVAATGPDTAVVEVGGVGIEVVCAPGTLAGLRPGEEATLATSLVVREDSLTLYGFADADERAVFEVLQTVSGVGPRLAQAALAVHSPDALRRAVATEDLVALTKVPGIGRKGAQRMVLELKDRLGPAVGPEPGPSAAPARAPGWADQVHAGLLALGWSAREADAAVSEVTPQAGDPPDVAALLRAALRILDRS
jgi:Holliday junction DNA helicase RuvA